MRVIAGEFKGRRLKAMPGVNTRPTSDKIKESIFQMIGPFFDGGSCLDLYAGSGSLGIEAVSRGMDTAVLVDKHPAAVKTIKENIELTKKPDQFEVMRKSASTALVALEQANTQFDLVLLDPPYEKQNIKGDILLLEEKSLLNNGAFIVCETGKFVDMDEQIGHSTLWKKKAYGSTMIWIYKMGFGGEE